MKASSRKNPSGRCGSTVRGLAGQKTERGRSLEALRPGNEWIKQYPLRVGENRFNFRMSDDTPGIGALQVYLVVSDRPTMRPNRVAGCHESCIGFQEDTQKRRRDTSGLSEPQVLGLLITVKNPTCSPHRNPAKSPLLLPNYCPKQPILSS
jgi:hypothetical protein